MKKNKNLIYLLLFMLIPLGYMLSGDKQSQGPQKGETVPEIRLPGLNEDTISLHQDLLKNSLILIDFWASWCASCREEHPDLVKAYKKYNDKRFQNGNGFSILSVSIDRNKESWKNAVENDNLKWPHHVLAIEGWRSQVCDDYGVYAIPRTFLIDNQGKLIAKDVKAKDLDKILNDLVLR